MKKRKNLLIILVILLIILALSFTYLLYLKDDYPHIYFPAYIEVLLWSLIITTPLAMLSLAIKGYKNTFVKVLIILIFTAFILFAFSVGIIIFEAYS